MTFRCPDPACSALVTKPQRGKGRITSKPVWMCDQCGSTLPRISESKTKQGVSK